LVEHIPNRGARVVSFNPDDVEQIYDIRNALECLSIRGATRNLALKDLLDFVRRLERLDRRNGPRWDQQRVEIDLELHRFIVSHCGNRRLATYLENISLLTHSLRVISGDSERLDLAVREHLDIVRALLRRDSELAERLMRVHIENSKRKVLDLVLQGRATVAQRLASTSRETIQPLPLR
jgi:DNA-binding GntR family transcriptional regulator